MKNYLDKVRVFLKKNINLFLTPTICKECYRGRLAIAAGIGTLLAASLGELTHPLLVSGVLFLTAGIFVARKNNWWID